MFKSIFCVKHEWFDKDGNRLEPCCATHKWVSSYRKATIEFKNRKEILFSDSPEKWIERSDNLFPFSCEDGTSELAAVEVHPAKGEGYIRVVLAAAIME